jgi:archaeal flagellar protein FlaJ
MEFKIPFTFSNIEILQKRSKPFMANIKDKETKLSNYLENSGTRIRRRQYLAICRRNLLINTVLFSTIITSLMVFLGGDLFYIQGLLIALLISGFIFLNQINYPKIYSSHKARDLEKNLIPALQDILVQLNSGVPIYRIMVNISHSDYGEVSKEFTRITSEINSGTSQIEAIEKAGKLHLSKYFQRVLWQISNGMRAGNDMSIVIRESIRNLSDEQAIQIQNYGSTLNPIIMFYMLIAVIIPSLGITFLIIIFSLLSIPERIIQIIFGSVFGSVVFMQIMFLGVIKSRRPSLL